MAKYQSTLGQLLTGSQNTINITGATGSSGYSNPWTLSGSAGTISIQDLATSGWETDPYVKKYQVLEIEEDLLALSCAWQRIREIRKTDTSGPYNAISKLTDPTLFNSVTEVDYTKAAQVRDYYSKKIMLWKLKGESLSRFREDMNAFIHTDGKIFKEDMMPLAYRLPEFYDYDSDFDMLSNEYIFNFMIYRAELLSMSIDLSNPLVSLLDIHTQNTIKVDAIYTKRSRDNNEYLVANKFKFV